MYLGYKENNKLKFKKYTNKEDEILFKKSQEEFSYLYKLCIEFEDINRLNNKLNFLCMKKYEEADIQSIQDTVTLYFTKIKNYFEKWKNRFNNEVEKRYYNELEKEYKKKKEFLLVYYLRNYEQHNGWIISYFKDTLEKNIELYFVDLTDLLEKNRINVEDRALFDTEFPDKNIKINIIDLLNKFTQIIKKFNEDIIQIYFIYNPEKLYYCTTLYSLLKACLNKEEGEIYMFEELPNEMEINFTKMIKSYYLNQILMNMKLEFDVNYEAEEDKIDYRNKILYKNGEIKVGSIMMDQYGVEWLIFSEEIDIFEEKSKVLLIPNVLPRRLKNL